MSSASGAGLSAPLHHQPSNGAPRGGRARACTSCRQVKLKCDARERAPASCSRCELNHLECKMDPYFKRIPARRQLEDVAQRVTYLAAAMGIEPDQTRPRNLSDWMRRSHRPDLRQLPLPGPTYQPSVSDDSLVSDEFITSPALAPICFYALEDENEVGTWSLEGVTFNADQIRTIFKHFDDTHYKHGPFLEPCTSLHAYYEKSELLFWTITMIGCYLLGGGYDQYYWKLLPHHRSLLSTKMMENRVALSTIHAMLCMATWTYPVDPEFDDITWMLCGAAIHTAMIMGLHKPGLGHEFSMLLQRDVGSQYTRNITWLSIFIISTGISSWLGMPPPLGAHSHLEVIGALCQDLSIPKWYRARADVHRQTVRVVNSIDANTSFNSRQRIISMYEAELYRVRDTYEDVWNDDLELEWHGAMLYLYGMAFVQPRRSGATNTAETALQAQEILLKGLATAVECVDTVMGMKLPTTAPGENTFPGVDDRVYQLGFYPKHFFRIGAFANYYLLWFLAVDRSASSDDKDTARAYITLTYSMLIGFNHSPEHKRGGEAIRALADMSMSMAGPAASQISARLGAGFMYSFMLAEASAGGATPTLGIDTVGPTAAAEALPGPLSAQTTGSYPSTASQRQQQQQQQQHQQHQQHQQNQQHQQQQQHSPQDTFSSSRAFSSPPQFDMHQAQNTQYLQPLTPTSTHSMPEQSQSMQHDFQAAMAAHGARSVPASAQAQQQQQQQQQNSMAMYNQMSHAPSTSMQAPFSTGEAGMAFPLYSAAAVPAMIGQFGYSYGQWDPLLLRPESHDPGSASEYLGGMSL